MAIILPGGVIGGKLPASLHYVTSTYLISTSPNPTTLTSLDFGDAVSGANEKWGFVSLLCLADSTVSVTGMSIGGNSGSIVYQQTQAAQPATFFVTSTFVMWTAQIDSLTSGVTVQFSEDTTTSIYVQVGYAVNLDLSSVIDSAKGTGASGVTLAVDCPAKGGIIANGFYAYGGAGPGIGNVSGGFNNLTQLVNYQNLAGRGAMLDGGTFSAAQTNLDVSMSVSPANGNPSAYAVSFAGV